MSRKSSLKTLEESKDSSKFHSFLKQPTNIRTNRNNGQRLRLARSNDTNNSGKISERSTRQNKILRKRRKQPSESIDSTRNSMSRRGATLRLFSNWNNAKNNHSFNSTIVCHRKQNSKGPTIKTTNISHSELHHPVSSRLTKYQRSATSWGNAEKEEQKQAQQTKSLHGSLISRRPSGLVRPKTSLGRNHSLYSSTKKYNYSCVQSKPSAEYFLTNRCNSEQGNIEIVVTEPQNETQEFNTNNSIRESNGPSQGAPRLTKNYSLNTIFERK